MARPSALLLIAAAACCAVLPRPACAQDTQYWTSTYGTKGQLLGGVLLGSPQDISAVYYNPGGFALIEKVEAVFSGSAYRYSVISDQNGLGSGRTLSSSSLSSVPSMFAGELPFSFLKGGRLGYVVLGRQYFDGRAQERGLTPGSALTVPDLRFFSGNVWVEESLNDTWGGLSWAHPLGPHVGAGVTQFVDVRSHRGRFAVQAQAIDSSGAAAALQASRDFDYQYWGLLWKFGISFQYPSWSMGFTLTTPSVKVFGSGSAGRDMNLVDEGVATPPATTVATDFQEGVASTYHNPLSIGAGGSYQMGHTRLHVAVEWFDGVAAYHVLATESFTAQSSGAVLTNDVIQMSDAVVNVGVGIEHHFNPKLAFYGAFRTDHSPLPDSSAANTTVSHWDLTHVSGGAAFTVGRLDLVVGSDVAWGGGKPQGLMAGLIGGGPEVPPDAKIKYFSATVMFGLKVAFGTGH